MDMFVFERTNSCTLTFEENGYLLVDWEAHTHRHIDHNSLKLECKASAKRRSFDMKQLPLALTNHSLEADINYSNLHMLTEFVNIPEHAQLKVQHDVLISTDKRFS